MSATPDSIVDDCIADLLRTAGVHEPPVDAIDVARRTGVLVVVDESSEARARTKRVGRRSVVFVGTEDRPERRQWAVAHELGEINAWRMTDALDLDDEARERLANRFASRLLLPEDWFRPAAAEHDRRLPDLKAVFGTASHELIATRLLDLPTPCAVTVFDNGRLVRRRSNGNRVPLQRFERDCWDRCRSRAEPIETRAPGVRVQCWPIHEPKWQREIVVTTAVEED